MRRGGEKGRPATIAAPVLGMLLLVAAFWESAEPLVDIATDEIGRRQAIPAVLASGSGPSPTRSIAADLQSGGSQPPNLLHEILDGSRLSASWLESHSYVSGSLALQRLHGLLQGHVSLASGKAEKIAFGPPDGASALPEGGVPVLMQQERYVQAVMRPDGLSGDSVLVRWRNATDNSIIELSAQAISPNASDPIPIWMRTTEDWPPGRYRVEVIAPDSDLALMAAGEFEIAVPDAPVTPFAWTAAVEALH